VAHGTDYQETSDNATWIGDKSYLNERGGRTRGAKLTSIDAIMRVTLDDDTPMLILIEWKYTETYETGREMRYADDGTDRVERYQKLIEAEDSPLQPGAPDRLFYEPYEQLMRQTLLAAALDLAQRGEQRGPRVPVHRQHGAEVLGDDDAVVADNPEQSALGTVGALPLRRSRKQGGLGQRRREVHVGQVQPAPENREELLEAGVAPLGHAAAMPPSANVAASSRTSSSAARSQIAASSSSSPVDSLASLVMDGNRTASRHEQPLATRTTAIN